jgi:hypothetical protein
MLPVGGIFGTREDALRAQSYLYSLGVLPDETYVEPINEALWTNLVDVDVPADAATLYEPYREGNTAMLVVRTSRLSPDEIDDVLEEHKGLVVRIDVAPPLADAPMRESEDR